jgi:hypothetical protein
MTRRSMGEGDRAGKNDRDVREVILSLADGNSNWPIGLRVSVKFTGCPADQRSRARE